MKKILFTLVAVTFIGSLCFAQQASIPAPQAAPKPVETKTFVGKVNSVSIGEAAKGIRPEIVVVDEKGLELSFIVISGTPITAKDGKTIALNEIKKGDKVSVEYITNKMDIHKTQAIKLVE